MSENAAPVMDVVLALVSGMVSVLVPLVPIVAGLKLLAIVGRLSTVKVAVAAVPLPALVVVTAPVLLR